MKRKILYVIAVLAVFLMPMAVYGATQTLSLTGEGDQTDGTYVGGATDYTNLNNSGTATYLQFSASGQYHCYDVTNTAITPDVINDVTITYKWTGGYFDNEWVTYSDVLTPYVRISGTNYYGSSSTGDGTWKTVEYEWATDPSTGVPWTESAIDSAQFGVKYTSSWPSGQQDGRIAYMYITVDYDPLTVPTVDTTAVDDITDTTATLNGNITATGGSNLDNRGFVWDTTSYADPGNVAPGATSYANSNTEAGTFGTGVFDYGSGVFVKGTTYYVRGWGHNAQGYAYGDEVTFTTIDDPSVTTDPANNIAVTTARVNSTVDDDGGEACDIRFGYGTTTQAVFNNYDTLTPWVNDTYTTGQTPYVDLTLLSAGTKYYFRVQIRNTSDNVVGSELFFTTESGVSAPTLLHVKPEAKSMSLTWLIGDGSTTTMVRYKEGGYPTSSTDGYLVYNGNMNNYLQEDLTEGTTYYYRGWGISGNLTSAGYAEVMGTTLADGASVIELDTPGSMPSWMQSSDYTNLSGTPIYGWMNWIADTWSMPRNTWWVIAWFMIPILLCVWLFYKNANIIVVAVVLAIGLTTGVMSGILAGWITFMYATTSAFMLWVGHRLT